MKEKDASKYFIFFFVFALIALGALVWPNQHSTESVTGSSHIQFEEKPERYAKTLENWADDFFHIDGIIFPKGVCPEIAKELLEQNIKKSPVVTEDFTTTGSQKICSLMFGFEQEFIGALEMIYGQSLLEKEVFILDLLKKGPKSFWQLTEAMYTNPIARAFPGCGIVESHLVKLENEGSIEREGEKIFLADRSLANKNAV